MKKIFLLLLLSGACFSQELKLNNNTVRVDASGNLSVDGVVAVGESIHLFHYYGDSSISKSYTTSWQHLTNGFGTMWINFEDDGFTVSNDTITVIAAGDYDLIATNTLDGDNGETQSIRFYNITQTAGIPTAGALTTRIAGNFGTIVTSGYAAFAAGDKLILQYKSDASGTSVYKNGTIKIYKVHEE